VASAVAPPAASAGNFRGLPLLQAADYMTPPEPPVYPPASIANDEQGIVVLRALVANDGTVRELLLWQSSGFARLDKAAQMAVRQWQFIPAHNGVMAQPAWVEVPVNFLLR
jgi:periplasmic protein TonB